MHRFLERLDGAASTIVPLLYLFGLALGAASYFAGVTLDAGLAVGVALAAAAELHSFLQQRRLRATWAQFQRLAADAPERDNLWTQTKINAWILVALLAFSAYNATAFVAATWRPVPGWLPGWLQIGIRGLIIPAFFFLSGFLAPLQTDASEHLHGTSADMLRRTLKAIGKQWRGRLAQAQKRNADLAPIAIALMRDVGDEASARRVELIAAGLDATTRPSAGTFISSVALEQPHPRQGVEESHRGFEANHHMRGPVAVGPQFAQASTAALSEATEVVSHHPDDPPHSSQATSSSLASKPENVTVLHRGFGRAPKRDRRTTSRINARSGYRGNAEARIRAALASRPSLTDEELMRVADVSSSTVSKWRRVIEAEHHDNKSGGVAK